MYSSEQVCYTTIYAPLLSDLPNEFHLIKCLEEGNIEVKTQALKEVIHLILNGEKFPKIVVPIIRFVLPLQDHTIKKLLQIFWEIVPKTNVDGKLLEEMILVCEYFRKDLLHPNKYVRGSTLRLLCKLKEPELLEPLISPILKCLECHHAYVRRNAILTIFTIYKNFDYLIPDALEVVLEFLKTEVDTSCKRNAFLMLMRVNRESALNYLYSCIDRVSTFEASLQLAILEFVYKICQVNPIKESCFIHCIYNLLHSNNSAVRYGAAGILVTLSNSPTAIKAAASCYIELIVKGNENNVKLIVLNQLIALKEKSDCVRVMQDLVMDVLQVLTASDLEVQQKVLSLVQDLISSRNVSDVMSALKKEITKTCCMPDCEDIMKYRQLLVYTLHSCCVKFLVPENTVITELLEFLPDFDEQTAVDILACVQETMQKFEHLRSPTVNKLLGVFSSIVSSKVHRSALWILGEYCRTAESIHATMTKFCQCIGNIPIVDQLKKAVINEETVPDSVTAPVQKLVTTDGTYAAQSPFSTGSKYNNKQQTPLRNYLINGNYFVGAALSSTLVKLALRYVQLTPSPKKQNVFIARSMLIMVSIMHLGKSGLTSMEINDDDLERISLCLKVLASHCPLMVEIFDVECQKSLVAMLAFNQAEEPKCQKVKEKKEVATQIDDIISFGQLTQNNASETSDMYEVSLTDDVASIAETIPETDMMSVKLNKVFQLTGFSDPVYIETYMYLNHDNVLLDVLIVNQTCDTLIDCSLELVASESLKFFEKPLPFILTPCNFCSVKVSAKISSSKGGIISGSMTYKENTSTTERYIVLNDIQIDAMQTGIVPATCKEQDFLAMWKEFVWENKVIVNTGFQDLNECVMFVALSTNTQCLMPEKMLSKECGFLSANLYGCSEFGERVAANVSIEKNPSPDNHVTGHVRIRSDCRDIALSLGAKLMSLSQRDTKIETGR